MNTKRSTLIAALILALAVGAGTAIAWGGPGGHGGAFHGGPGAALRGVMRIMHRLDLSEEQRDAILKILDNARTQIQPHREALQEGRQQMRALDPSSFDEAAVRAIAESQAKEIEEIMVIGQRARSQVWAVLTPEQREEAKKIRSEMEERFERMRECMEEAGGPSSKMGHGHRRGGQQPSN